MTSVVNWWYAKNNFSWKLIISNFKKHWNNLNDAKIISVVKKFEAIRVINILVSLAIYVHQMILKPEKNSDAQSLTIYIVQKYWATLP